jgi:CrcB protein
MNMKAIILVAVGGAIGSLLRYAVAVWMREWTIGGFPWHTFTVNIIGCLLIGILFSWSVQPSFMEEIRWFLMIGILGGFTTFSSFGLEAFDLIKQQKTTLAMLYVISTNLLGILAVCSGYMLHKWMN